MIEKIKGYDQSIFLAFFALSVLTPLIFSTKNTELFEVPKMLFVYFMAAIILTLTFLKFVIEKKISIPKNLAVLSFLIFLSVQLISTLTSIDKFTSIFGFPSRLNGGLISQIAYFIIFALALINLNKKKAEKLLIACIASALAVSLWGIPAHFGKDPNCLILTTRIQDLKIYWGELTSTCWQKEFDPTVRIFSTLGQPNWLASYLVLIIPITLAFATVSKAPKIRVFFALSLLLIFFAFILTNSRAGIIGLLVSVTSFIGLLGLKRLKRNYKILFTLLIPVVVLIFLFGSSLLSRLNEAINPSPKSVGGTESGQIRLIVWKGAIELSKRKPLLGTGPETFAYSYYSARPAEHNQTTEWNFFYNKAHNEFLNYLANIGYLGLFSYLVFFSVVFFTLFKISKNSDPKTSTFAVSVLSAILGYHATIFFGFSVVATQTLIFLSIAYILILANNQQLKNYDFKLHQVPLFVLVSATGLGILIFVSRIYLADLYENSAKTKGNLTDFQKAINMFPAKNPFYVSDFSSALSENENFQKASELAKEANALAPNNVLIKRRTSNVYILLAQNDPKYANDSVSTAEELQQLALTDPQSYLTLAKAQIVADQKDKAKISLQKALELKPDFEDAKELLEQIQ